MFEDEIKNAIVKLSEVSSLLSRLQHRVNELLPANDDSYYPFLRRCANDDVSKLNKKVAFPENPKEIYDMIINLPGVSINSKPRKDGRYQGYINDKNGRTYVYGKTLEEVAVKLKYFIRYGTPKKHKFNTTLNGVPTTFTAFAMYYFENFRKKKVAEKTYYSDLKRFDRYLKPYFKETPIKKISPKDCQTLVDEIESSGKGKTADEIFSLLSVILKMAIKHSIISNNPIDIVYHVQHERKHGKALTKEEEKILKSKLEGTPYLTVCMIALYTGIRPNELKTAKLDGNFIVAVNSKRKTKRVEYKRIPISKMLKPYITSETFYVPGLNLLRQIIRETLPGHILYDLRTTFYSRLKECGVSEHARNAFMGHSLGSLGDAYTDLSDEYLLKEMDKFEY